MTDIKAIVTSGRGLAAKVRAAEVAQISFERGLNLINGSLNLVSTRAIWLDIRLAIFTNNRGFYYWQGFLEGTPVIINRWLGTCPAHVFEIFSEENLRQKFGLRDGDRVSLSIPDTILERNANRSIKNHAAWFLVWRGREKQFYKDGVYMQFLQRDTIRKYIWRTYQYKIG